MPRHKALDEIQRLDPERDHQRIAYLTASYEFPFDTTRALEFAIYRTLAVPSISALLAHTGEFLQRPQKRYDDTDLIISELYENGYDSERGKAALRRMNRLHGRFAISNADYLYVLSTFVFEPIRWMERFGWRAMVPNEQRGLFHFWRAIGRRMNIKDIPTDYDAFERYNREYEQTHFHYTPANRRLAATLRDTYLGWFIPRPAWPLAQPFVYALMDEPLLEAFGFPKPAPALRRLVETAVRARARLVRQLPERRTPRRRTEGGIHHRTYPHGYRIEELGPRID
jgi:hypothetical protein